MCHFSLYGRIPILNIRKYERQCNNKKLNLRDIEKILLQENLDCPELIEAFELKHKAAKKPEKRKAPSSASEPKAKRKDGDRPRGFDRCLDPERIIGKDHEIKTFVTKFIFTVGII